MEKLDQLRERLEDAHALGIMLEKHGWLLYSGDGSEEGHVLWCLGKFFSEKVSNASQLLEELMDEV